MRQLFTVVATVALFLTVGTVLATTHHASAKPSPYVSALSPLAVPNAAACSYTKCHNLLLYSAGCDHIDEPYDCWEVFGPQPHPCQNELCGE